MQEEKESCMQEVVVIRPCNCYTVRKALQFWSFGNKLLFILCVFLFLFLKMSFSTTPLALALALCAVFSGAAQAQSISNTSVVLNYFGSVNCSLTGPASAPSAFTTQVKSSNGVCNVVEGGGGTGGSWAVNCNANSTSGDLFFCSDSACKEGCQKQPFSDNVCVPILVKSAPNSASSFQAKCVQGAALNPGNNSSSGTDSVFLSIGALSVFILSSLRAL